MKTIKLDGTILDLDKINKISFDFINDPEIGLIMLYELNGKDEKIKIAYFQKELVENYYERNSVYKDATLWADDTEDHIFKNGVLKKKWKKQY